jgi:chromosome partitioning protein
LEKINGGCMRAVLVANPKGGAGKTTLATNLSGYFANNGQKTTLCDLDRQQSALRWMAFRDAALPPLTGYFAGNQIGVNLPSEADWVMSMLPQRGRRSLIHPGQGIAVTSSSGPRLLIG